MQRMPTGIPGLDELMEGGLPLGRIIAVLGNSGSGRSILGLQCLHTGAKKFSEPGLYVTLGAPAAQVRQEALRFGWNLRKLEEQNMLQFLDGSKTKQGLPGEEDFSLQPLGFDLDRLLLEIMRTAKRIGAKRLVFDSLPTLGFNYERPLEVNQALFKLVEACRRLGVTTLLIGDNSLESGKGHEQAVAETLADGIIVLNRGGPGQKRTLHIRKMRATHHADSLHTLEITENGVAVGPALSPLG